MGYYRVPLYKLEVVNSSSIKRTFIDNIIVRKTVFGLEEVFTEYNKILLLNRVYYSPNFNVRDFTSFRDYCRRIEDRDGCFLYVFKDFINSDTKVRIRDMERFSNEFEKSNWKKFYHQLEEKKCMVKSRR